jgi:hypothetical protein
LAAQEILSVSEKSEMAKSLFLSSVHSDGMALTATTLSFAFIHHI